jgi:NHL repeat
LTYGVAVDSGNVYAADGSNNRIEKFTGSGAFLSSFEATAAVERCERQL